MERWQIALEHQLGIRRNALQEAKRTHNAYLLHSSKQDRYSRERDSKANGGQGIRSTANDARALGRIVEHRPNSLRRYLSALIAALRQGIF